MIFEIIVIFTTLMIIDICRDIYDPSRHEENCIIYDDDRR